MSGASALRLTDRVGRALGRWLEAVPKDALVWVPSDHGPMVRCLRPGDVVLVEGASRVSAAIKYLTQST